MSRSDFRKFLPELGEQSEGRVGTTPLFGLTLAEFIASFNEERRQRHKAGVDRILASPYKGVTIDGTIVPNLFELRDEGAPTEQILQAASAFLSLLTADEKKVTCQPIDGRERQFWQNSIANPGPIIGLRLDQTRPQVRDAGLAFVRSSLSRAGYDKALTVMKLNAFLGQLVGAPLLMNEYSYALHFFGEPSATEPWGWQLVGHHLIITCFILGTQMTLTPTFMGAEPTFADDGPFAGTRAFEDEENRGLEFACSLSPEQKKKAVIYETTLRDLLPPGRHQDRNGLVFGGASQDNRVIPYEGLTGAEMSPTQRRSLLDLAHCYVSTLPSGPLQARMGDIEKHSGDTYFSWAGGMNEDNVFYYRIQSPVVMIEFDHQWGVVLNNPNPEKFHIHTIVRTPNGNDYGMDLLRLHYETAPHHKAAHHEHTHDAHDHTHDHDHAHGHHHHHHDDDGGHHHEHHGPGEGPAT